jgi:hypothetical protein
MSSAFDEPDFGAGEMNGRHASAAPPWLLAAAIFAICIPDAFSFALFGLRLTVARLVLLALAPCALIAYGRLVSSGRYRFVLSDLFMPLTGLWIIIAPSAADGLSQGIVKGGVMALDFVVAYAAMRAIPQERQETEALVKILCAALSIAGYLSIFDPLTGAPFLQELALGISGYQFDNAGHFSAEDLLRFGLMRASGPFGHPILLGTAMAYGLVFTYALRGTFRVLCGVGCAIGLVASFSSAPLLALIVAVILAIYGKLVQFRGRWFVLGMAATLCFMLFVLLHPAPFGWLLGHFLLNAQTGNYRLLIWQYAGEGVLASPMMGMGLMDPYPTRPVWLAPTVDSIWLMSAMQFGITGSVLIASSIVSACWASAEREDQEEGVGNIYGQRMAKCLSMNLLLTILLGFTVHFWGNSWILLGLMAGLRASFSQWSAGVRRQDDGAILED